MLHVVLNYAKLNSGLTVVISLDDVFKYTSFYKDILEAESTKFRKREYDLCDLGCPFSKIKATELIDNLN